MYVQYGVHFIAASVSISMSLLHILSTREQSNLADSHNLQSRTSFSALATANCESLDSSEVCVLTPLQWYGKKFFTSGLAERAD